MVYLESPSTDPYFNLALEQYVFDCLPRDREYFMLWQNDNTIVVGKHQNTAEEINADFVRTHGVRVVRRLSGGGAVYHDLGNLNFTFVMDAGADSALDLHLFCRPVARALQKLGVDAQVNGRNSISWDEKFLYDVEYVDNVSLGLDASIFLRTILATLRRSGISAEGEATMPEFMGDESKETRDAC